MSLFLHSSLLRKGSTASKNKCWRTRAGTHLPVGGGISHSSHSCTLCYSSYRNPIHSPSMFHHNPKKRREPGDGSQQPWPGRLDPFTAVSVQRGTLGGLPTTEAIPAQDDESGCIFLPFPCKLSPTLMTRHVRILRVDGSVLGISHRKERRLLPSRV